MLSIPKKVDFFGKIKSEISRIIEKIIWAVTAAWRNFYGWGSAYFVLSALFLLVPCLMAATDSPHATFANWIPFHLFFTIPWLIGGILYGSMFGLFSAQKYGYIKKQTLPLQEPELQVIITSP